MKYSKRYIAFTVMLALVFLFKFQILGVDRAGIGQFRGAQLEAKVWNPLVARDVNANLIKAVIDNQEYTNEQSNFYMNNNRNIMLPVALLRDALNCSAHIYDGKELLVGNDRLMKENGIAFDEKAFEALTMSGSTPLMLAADGKYLGIIGVADAVKPDSEAAIESLRSHGIDTWLVTGDNERTAKSVADKVGIKNIKSSCLPEDKNGFIGSLRSSGKHVAMVGDGINDAAALASADVGIAIGTGTDVAMASADIVLAHGELTGISNAIMLSKATLRIIKQNLFWAFAYNTLGIPIAAGLLHAFGGPLLSPMIAALAMSLSSVTVLANALRLKVVKLK